MFKAQSIKRSVRGTTNPDQSLLTHRCSFYHWKIEKENGPCAINLREINYIEIFIAKGPKRALGEALCSIYCPGLVDMK